MKRPNFYYEREFWKKGFKTVVGVDEVGRGAFAGPVVAAAVVFAPAMKQSSNLPVGKAGLAIEQLGINDSKLLKPKTRVKLAEQIKKHASVWSVAEVSVSVINRLGIGKASAQVMRKVVGSIIDKITRSRKNVNREKTTLFVLVDGFHVKYIPGVGLKKQKAIINGDQKSISIAAASILAKVHRDKLMLSLSKQSKYKKYGWGRNKGYGTKEHQKAILRYGLTCIHRKDFIKTWRKSKSKIRK